MTVENPTQTGASISERLENFLAASDNPQPQPQSGETDPQAEQYSEAAETPETTEAEPEGDVPDQEGESLTLSDLSKYLGIDESNLDVDEDGTVKVKTKIDGKEGTAKLNELIKSYQLQGHVDAKAREAAEQAKSLQERVQQFETYAKTEAEKLSKLAYIANQELMRDAADIDWQSLARNDPAEYVAKQAEFQARQNRVSQLMAEANNQNSQWQQAQQMRMQQQLQSEMSRLPTLIPEWADQKTMESEKAQLRTWLKSRGYTDQDISGLTRADLVADLRKAMLFDQSQSKKSVVDKKVRVAPKLVKPGQSMDANQRNNEALREMRLNIRKSGGKRGIAEYLMATGKV